MTVPVPGTWVCSGSAGQSTSYQASISAWGVGDLVVAIVGHSTATSTGWPTSAPNDWVEVTGESDTRVPALIAYRIMEAGDADPIFTSAVNGYWAVLSVTFQAGTFNATDPIDVATLNEAWNRQSGSTATASALTTINADAYAIAAQTFASTSGDVSLSAGGWVEPTQSPCKPTSGIQTSVATREIPSPGSTTDCTWTNPFAWHWTAGMVAIRGSGGAAPIVLNIEGLTHAHPVDSPDVSGNFLLVIDELKHGHPVDQVAVSEVGANFPLDIAGLTHGHPVDQADVSPDFFLDIEELKHGQNLGEPTLTVLPNALDIDNLIHAHPVDEAPVFANYPLIIEGLTHGHPVDQANVTALEGSLTAVLAQTAGWSADAGVQLDTTEGADLNWHIIEVVFDGLNTIIAVDGVEVTGNAGIRLLQALTLGAQGDGTNRLQGTVGELRVYAGRMTTNRPVIRNELNTKWITG